tara:strand:- start:653 stop:826 length:174 start_codon:yes stop_codon:yes gene_type:complete
VVLVELDQVVVVVLVDTELELFPQYPLDLMLSQLVEVDPHNLSLKQIQQVEMELIVA